MLVSHKGYLYMSILMFIKRHFYLLVLFESLPGQEMLMLPISNTGLVYGVSWAWSGKQLIIYIWRLRVPNINAYLLHHIARLDVSSPDSNVHGANMGPIWGRQDRGGPHIGPMIFAIWVIPAWCKMAAGLKEIDLSAMSSMEINTQSWLMRKLFWWQASI